MKAVVFLSLICVSTALPHVFLADTPEVQMERQRFYQLYNAAAKAAADAPDINIHHGPQQPHTSHVPTHHNNVIHNFNAPRQVHQQPHHFPSSQQFTKKWTGPLAAKIPAGLPGSEPQVRNTPEVEAAIANFNAAYNAAVVSTRSSPQQQYQGFNQPPAHSQHRFSAPVAQPKWTGPLAATVPAGLPGSVPQVADTPEVVAAKTQFNRAFQNQLSHVFG